MLNSNINNTQEINNLKTLVQIIISALFVTKNDKLVLKENKGDTEEIDKLNSQIKLLKGEIDIYSKNLEELRIKLEERGKLKIGELNENDYVPDPPIDDILQKHIRNIEGSFLKDDSKMEMIKKNEIKFQSKIEMIDYDDVLEGVSKSLRKYDSSLGTDVMVHQGTKIKSLNYTIEKLKQQIYAVERKVDMNNHEVKYSQNQMELIVELQNYFKGLKSIVEKQNYDIFQLADKINLYTNQRSVNDFDTFATKVLSINVLLNNQIKEFEKYKKDNNVFVCNLRDKIYDKIGDIEFLPNLLEDSQKIYNDLLNIKQDISSYDLNSLSSISQVEIDKINTKIKNLTDDFKIFKKNTNEIINNLSNGNNGNTEVIDLIENANFLFNDLSKLKENLLDNINVVKDLEEKVNNIFQEIGPETNNLGGSVVGGSAMLGNLQTQLDNFKKVTATNINEIDSSIMAIVNNVSANKKSITTLETNLTTTDNRLTKNINDVDNKLTKNISDVDNKLTKNINDVDIRLSKNINDNDARITNNLNLFKDNVNKDLYVFFEEGNKNNVKNYYFNKSYHSYIETGDISIRSDRRLKENIRGIDNYYEKMMELQGVSYRWKVSQENDIGFIAQDVEFLFPELVETDKNGIKSIKYPKFVALLTEVVKKQDQEISFMKKILIGCLIVITLIVVFLFFTRNRFY